MMPNDSDRLAELLRADRARAFAPGFADRVLARVAHDRAAHDRAAANVTQVLPRQVARVLPAVLAASLVLAAVNYWRGGTAGSPLAGAIGLPSVTVASALTLSSTADAETLP